VRADYEDVDLLYGLADAVVRFMDSGPSFPVVLLYIGIAAIPVALLHELGHAVVARRRLDTEVEVTVGTVGRIAEVRLGEIKASVSAVGTPGRPAGSAEFDSSQATAQDILWIALAGPLASLVGAALSVVLFSTGPADGPVHDLLWATVAGGVFGVLLNIVPFEFQERRHGPVLRTDGRLALDALRVARSLR